MVGDKLETDILGGIRADLGGTVWVPLNPDSIEDPDPNPDYVIESVMELPRLLPNNPKVPRFRKVPSRNKRGVSLPDLEDNCSNSSDGS